MNKRKRIISLLLSLIMALSAFSIVPFSVSAEDIDSDDESETDMVEVDLTLDQSASLHVSSKDDTAIFHFAAINDALIKFTVSDNLYFSVNVQHKSHFRFGSPTFSFGKYSCTMYCTVEAGEEYYINCTLNTWSIPENGVDFTASAEVIPTSDLLLGNTETSELHRGDISHFRFDAETDAMLDLLCEETSDPDDWIWYDVTIYDSNMQYLKGVHTAFIYDFLFPVEKGETYYITCELGDEEGGTLDLTPHEIPVEDIGIGHTKPVNIEEEGGFKMFRFVPDRDMQAVFTSAGKEYPRAYLYDNQMKELVSVNRAASNFKLSYKVEKDDVYYLKAGFFYSNWTGEYTVTVSEYEPEEIKLGETKTVNIENEGDTVDYKFVPEENMVVEFCSHIEDNGTEGYIFNEDMEILSEDDPFGGGDFQTIAYVEAGETYYLRSAMTYSSDTGSFDVELRKFEPEEIKLGETKRVEINKRWGNAWFKFTAPYDCYVKTSTEDDDLYVFGAFDFEEDKYKSNSHGGGSSSTLLQKEDIIYLRAYIDDFDTEEGSFDVTISEGEEIKLGETKNLEEYSYLTFRADHDMLVHYTSTGIDDEEHGQYIVVQAGKSERFPFPYSYVAGRSGTGNINLLFHAYAGETYFIRHEYWDMTVDVSLNEYSPIDIDPNKIKEASDTAYFKFVPDKNMTVSFESVNSDINVLGTVLDEDLIMLLTNTFTKEPEKFVDKGDKNDFALSYDLKAGETYYFKSEPKANASGSYQVILKADDNQGMTVKGAVTSFIDESDVTVKLTGNDNDFTATVTGTDDYTIEDVPEGEYTLTVSKKDHVTREYTVNVTDEDVTQDVKINPVGDVNGDGSVSIADYSRINKHVCKVKSISGYEFKCADVNGDGNVSIADLSRVNKHVCKVKKLW